MARLSSRLEPASVPRCPCSAVRPRTGARTRHKVSFIQHRPQSVIPTYRLSPRRQIAGAYVAGHLPRTNLTA